MSRRVHVIGAGGPAGIGLTRCLKEWYEVTGEDDSQWGRLAMECPAGSSDDADMVVCVPDSVVMGSSFRPHTSQIALCQDKAETARVLGDLAPKTYWLRDTYGAGGKGAQMLTGYLPGRNYSVEFVMFEDRMLAAFAKERVSYSVKKKTEGLENVGSSAVSVCVENDDVVDAARGALHQVKKATGTPLHGFYGVDLKEDENGVPRVTEINAGRLLTASYSYYWLTGYNLPLLGAKAYFGEDLPPLPDYPAGYGVIRQADMLPKLVPPDVTASWS